MLLEEAALRAINTLCMLIEVWMAISRFLAIVFIWNFYHIHGIYFYVVGSFYLIFKEMILKEFQ